MTEPTTETSQEQQEATPVPENPMAEDMTTEEVMPDLKDAAQVSKGMKKIEKLAQRIVSRMNGRLNAERDITRKKITEGQEKVNEFIRDFAQNTNENIKRFEKKYEGMYSYLVRQFLVNLEQRVFTNEIFTQGVLDVVVRRLYELEEWKYMSTTEVPEGSNLEPFMSYEDYLSKIAKEHEEKMNEIANKIATQQAEEAKAAKEAQGVKSGDGEGSEEAGSVGGEGSEGQEADTDVSGTDSGADSQDSEQPTQG